MMGIDYSTTHNSQHSEAEKKSVTTESIKLEETVKKACDSLSLSQKKQQNENCQKHPYWYSA